MKRDRLRIENRLEQIRPEDLVETQTRRIGQWARKWLDLIPVRWVIPSFVVRRVYVRVVKRGLVRTRIGISEKPYGIAEQGSDNGVPDHMPDERVDRAHLRCVGRSARLSASRGGLPTSLLFTPWHLELCC